MVAYQGYEEVRDNFVAALDALLDGGCVRRDRDPRRVADRARRCERVAARPGPRGVRVPDAARRPGARGDKLVADGHRLRIYVPFGEQWYEYSLRRLQENPKIAGYVARTTSSGVNGK